ncbi:MAG: hypothetical protein WDW38_005796 [Sanguina aurantia]
MLVHVLCNGIYDAATKNMMADIYETISEHAVVVYSKSYCPYCKRAKELFKRLGVHAEVHELDQLDDGREIQLALKAVTGRSTVPQIFIGGNFVGGSDDLMASHASGILKDLLAAVGLDIAGSQN